MFICYHCTLNWSCFEFECFEQGFCVGIAFYSQRRHIITIIHVCLPSVFIWQFGGFLYALAGTTKNGWFLLDFREAVLVVKHWVDGVVSQLDHFAFIDYWRLCRWWFTTRRWNETCRPLLKVEFVPVLRIFWVQCREIHLICFSVFIS